MGRGDIDGAAEYYDRWEKHCEKLVTAELHAKKIKETNEEAAKLAKVKKPLRS